MLALWAMFFAAFLAATLIPAKSGAVLIGMLLPKCNPVWLLLRVATTGNVSGSLVNWAIGRLFARPCQSPLAPGIAGPGGARPPLVCAPRVAEAVRVMAADHRRSFSAGFWLAVRAAVARGAGCHAGQGRAPRCFHLAHPAVYLTLKRRAAPTG